MKSFKLCNIKSFKNSGEIEIKPLTLFVGRNSCGKSSLTRFPVLIAQTFKNKANTPLLLFGDMLDYGNYNDVINRHIKGDMEFTLGFGPEVVRYIQKGKGHQLYFIRKDMSIYNWFDTIERVDLQVKVSKPDKKMIVKTIQLCVNDNLIFTMNNDDIQYELHFQNPIDVNGKVYNTEINSSSIKFKGFLPLLTGYEITRTFIEALNYSDEWKEQQLRIIDDGGYRLIDDKIRQKASKRKWYPVWTATVMIETIFKGISQYMDDYAEEMTYVGPFRENPKRIYRDSENNYENVGVKGENAGMLLRQDWQNQRRLIKSVSEWFKKSMGYEISIDEISENLYSLVVTNKLNDGTEEKDNLIDVGYGISQVLPIVTELMADKNLIDNRYTDRYRIKKNFVIEQPELHLHPAAQAELADLLVQAANVNRSRRIIVETHSEHLIRKLQVLIADPNKPIDNDQVAIYYVEKDENGESFIKKMEIAENGQFLTKWPSGFFDKGFELSTALISANRKRE